MNLSKSIKRHSSSFESEGRIADIPKDNTEVASREHGDPMQDRQAALHLQAFPLQREGWSILRVCCSVQ